MWPDLPLPVEVSGEASRQRLFEAVARFLLALARTADVGDSRMARSANPANPLFFFLDDLHWADPSTLDLLHYLVRNLSAARVWIVGTYRPEEVTLSHPLTRLRQGLSRDHLVDRLVLKPLPPEAVGQIACSLVGEREGEALGTFLYRESEGNPFILTETVSDLQEQGALRRGEDGLWQWAGPPAAELALSKAEGTLPAGVQDVVLQRVGRLREPAQRLLTLAAVIGRQFDIALLQAAAGPDVEAVDESLDEWLRRRLVQTDRRPPTADRRGMDASGGHRYDFAHDKIRAVVYHAVGAGQRRRLHQRVGEALEGLHAGRLEAESSTSGRFGVYEQLAHHYEHAGAVDKAVTYLPLAATRARAVYAHQEALDYYDRALALLGERDERRWEILLLRGRVLRFLGRYDEAIADCQQVVEAGAGDLDNWLLATQAATELSMIYRTRCDYDEARTWGERAYELAGEAGGRAEPPRGARSGDRPQRFDRPQQLSAREQARAKQMLGEIEREQGNLESAQRLFEEALALHRAMADQRGVAECLNRLGHVFSDWGHYDAARQRMEEALVVFRALGDQQSQAACLRVIGFTHWRQGANDAARRAFADSLDICRAIGDRRGEADCLIDLGLAYIAGEAYDETRRCWEESAALYLSLGLQKRAARCLHNLGILHQLQGLYATAQQCLEESLAVHRAIGARLREALDLGWLGKLHLLRGDYENARNCLEAAIALDREVGGSAEEAWHRAWLGAVAYETGDLVGAKDHFREAVRLAEKGGEDLGSFEMSWLVAVHLAQGDGEAALSAAREVLATAEAAAAPTEMGASCALLGAVHGSGLLAEAEDPAPYFERALALLEDSDPFGRGVALRRYGAYLLHGGNPEQGQAHLREAQALFERIGARGELVKVTRLLAGDDSPRLRW